MKSSDVESAPDRVRVLNAVVLQNAFFCVFNAMLTATAHTTHVRCAGTPALSNSKAFAGEPSAESRGVDSLGNARSAVRSCAELSDATHAPHQGNRLIRV